MADRRRVVTLSPGGRPVLDIDLETAPTYAAIRDTFAYAPGQANSLTSREPGRYGGQQVVGELNDNGQVSWQAFVRGNAPDQVAQNIEALLMSGAKTTRGRLLEWRPDGATYSSYFQIAGPITWKPTYSWAQWMGGNSMIVEVAVPVRPLVLWDPMTVNDPFDVDSRGDYTFDAATSADAAVSGGAVTPVVGASLATERRARHTIRGYKQLEGQASITSTPGATITGHKTGVLLRASASNTYVEVYVDDNGTNSRLQIDIVIAGVRTNRALTNLAARIPNAGQGFAVRGRIEGQAVIAEHFLNTAPLTGTPTTTNTYTLSGGEQASLVAGYAGWSWVPQHASAKLDDFDWSPFIRRAVALPATISPLDAIPGTAPAAVDVAIGADATTDGKWAQIAWTGRRTPGAGLLAPFGLFDSEDTTAGADTFTTNATAAAHGGHDLRTTGASGRVYWGLIDPSAIQPDDFSETVDLEVWARVILTSTLVTPAFTASIRPLGQASFIGELFTEWGSIGRIVTVPSSGTVYRITRLGTVTVPVGLLGSGAALNIAASASGSGTLGLDYAWIVPAQRSAVAPTGVAGAVYPDFALNTITLSPRIIRHDLSGLLVSGSYDLTRILYHGLGGNLIHPAPGLTDWFVKVSNLVPDDPTVVSSSELLAYTATVRLDVTPRSYMLRSA